jgi:hypothetical protein
MNISHIPHNVRALLLRTIDGDAATGEPGWLDVYDQATALELIPDLRGHSLAWLDALEAGEPLPPAPPPLTPLGYQVAAACRPRSWGWTWRGGASVTRPNGERLCELPHPAEAERIAALLTADDLERAKRLEPLDPEQAQALRVARFADAVGEALQN